ncbi:hypothetical protein [Nocardioides sp. TF02-7]|nr:hypothetical protein [Nocardioides sp. TF02-7]
MSVTVTEEARPELGVAMIGYAFMGAAHAQAWRTAPGSSTSPPGR